MMITRIVQFSVAQDSLEEARKLIADFAKTVREKEEGTLIYSTYEKEGVPGHFIHLMQFKDSKAQEIHRTSSYCGSFVRSLYPICNEEPFFETLKEI